MVKVANRRVAARSEIAVEARGLVVDEAAVRDELVLQGGFGQPAFSQINTGF